MGHFNQSVTARTHGLRSARKLTPEQQAKLDDYDDMKLRLDEALAEALASKQALRTYKNNNRPVRARKPRAVPAPKVKREREIPQRPSLRFLETNLEEHYNTHRCKW